VNRITFVRRSDFASKREPRDPWFIDAGLNICAEPCANLSPRFDWPEKRRWRTTTPMAH